MDLAQQHHAAHIVDHLVAKTAQPVIQQHLMYQRVPQLSKTAHNTRLHARCALRVVRVNGAELLISPQSPEVCGCVGHA